MDHTCDDIVDTCERKKKQQKEKERERKENEINWQLGQPRLLSLTTFWVNNES